MIVRTGGPNDIPALQAIEKKPRTVYAALAGFEFAAASPLIAVDRRHLTRVLLGSHLS
jgi:hypothetical protein